jgi:tRNA threonylcarbamoyladenosine modification (KEOPS) complex Cgi121 subunit
MNEEVFMIRIFGAKGNINNVNIFLEMIIDFEQKHDITIQVFNADLIYGKNHLFSSVEHAIRAINNKSNTTNSFAKEILLYASGERQLKLAIPKMGVRKGYGNIAFVFVSDDDKTIGRIADHLIDEMLGLLSFNRNDRILEGNRETLRNFGIDENEIETVKKANYASLILEKVAMVDIIK